MSIVELNPSDGDGGENEDGVHGERGDAASAATDPIRFTQRATSPLRPTAAAPAIGPPTGPGKPAVSSAFDPANDRARVQRSRPSQGRT